MLIVARCTNVHRLLYKLRVQQVTRQGKSYRPMDFAFADEPADGPGSGSAAARQTAKNSLTKYARAHDSGCARAWARAQGGLQLTRAPDIALECP